MIDLSVAIFGTLAWVGTLTICWILRQFDPAGNLRSLRLYFLLLAIGWTIILGIQVLSVLSRADHTLYGWLVPIAWLLHDELSFRFAVLFMPIQAVAALMLVYALLRPRIIPIKPIEVAQITIDLRGTIVAWNEAAEHLLGWTADEVMGKELAPTIIPQEYRQAHLDGMERFRATGAAPLLNKLYPVIALCKEGEGTPTQKRLVVDLNLTSRTDAEGTQYFVGQLTPRTPLV